jgi:methylmalonyl-CoA mutase
VRDIDNASVRNSQIARLKDVRANAIRRKVEAALAALARARRRRKSAGARRRSRARPRHGRRDFGSDGKVFGRYRAQIRSISGVYGGAYEGDNEFAALRGDIEAFAKEEGRRPRILVAKMGQDGHDRGAKVIATAFADLGFDVDIGPLFQTPEEVAKDAIESDVHVIGVSSQAAGHKALVPQLIEALRKQKADDILVVAAASSRAGLRLPRTRRRRRHLRPRHEHSPKPRARCSS